MKIIRNEHGEIVGYEATEQEHGDFIESIIEQILTPEDYKRYQSLPDTAISKRTPEMWKQ